VNCLCAGFTVVFWEKKGATEAAKCLCAGLLVFFWEKNGVTGLRVVLCEVDGNIVFGEKFWPL
jgi:hypothetical protein